jgi:hypothetical protein
MPVAAWDQSPNAAVGRKNLDMVKYLVEEANPDVFVDLPDDSILVHAAESSSFDIVQSSTPSTA